MRHRRVLIVAFLTGLCIPGQSDAPKGSVTPEVLAVLDGIQAADLRADLSYIASDELKGRDSPSPGLDLAADYIAAQFKRAGLEPAVGDSYFQNAAMLVGAAVTPVDLKLSSGDRRFTASQTAVVSGLRAGLDLSDAPVFKLDLADEAMVQHLTASQVEGKVVITEIDPKLLARLRSTSAVLASGKPALVIRVDKKGLMTRELRPRQLMDPDRTDKDAASPRVTISGEDAARFYAELKPGANNATATVHIAAPQAMPATLRNVIGVLRGSDPVLRDTYVLLTAHYDHLGVRPDGRIFNGANDDGSGTVSVIEAARALGRLTRHPRRSIVFAAFFGEEEGLIGSQYYARHPLWPLGKTVADLNLEQVGRTDSTEGPQISNASLTGFDYSDLTNYVQRAGASTGIRIYKNSAGSDAYFSASDNLSFAAAGVPAQTLCVAFDYKEYHAVGDDWQKIDYNNMAKVDRAIALAIFLMADSEQPVRWNEANPKTTPYVKASKAAKAE